MINLQSYYLSNFKGFNQGDNIAADWINVLTGVNSGGKTTLIHALLFLKEMIESQDSEIKFIGKYVKLGDFNDVVYKGKKNLEMKLGLNLVYIKDEQDELMFNEIAQELGEEQADLKRLLINVEFGLCLWKEKVILSRYHVIFSSDSGKQSSFTLLHNTDTECYEITASPLDIFRNYSEFGLSLEPNTAGELHEQIKKSLQQMKQVRQSKNLMIDFDGALIPKQCYLDQSKGYTFYKIYTEYVKKILKQFCNQIFYIGPVRMEPQLVYTYDQGADPERMNPRGDNATYIYHNLFKKSHKFVLPPSNEGEPYTELTVEEKTYEEIVSMWADYIMGSSKANFRICPKGVSSYELRVAQHLITNVGFGSSQIFPILLEGIRQKNGVLVLEQPELHLHPAAQARMVDFFIAVTKYNQLKLIIETHSVHMINRMVRRIVEDPATHASLQISFIDVKNEKSKIAPLRYDSYGVVEEWPENFLNQQGHKEAQRLYRAQKKKMQELRE